MFCDILQLRNADIKTLLAEAKQIRVTDSLEYITQVFLSTSHFLEVLGANPADADVACLLNLKIFPIQTAISYSSFDFLSTASDIDEWYIADRLHLRQCFEGKLHLLAFDEQTIQKIEPVIRRLGLEERLLSKVATAEVMTEGEVEIHDKFTASLCEKAKYIAL